MHRWSLPQSSLVIPLYNLHTLEIFLAAEFFAYQESAPVIQINNLYPSMSTLHPRSTRVQGRFLIRPPLCLFPHIKLDMRELDWSSDFGFTTFTV